MSFPSIPPFARLSMLRSPLALPVYAFLYENALTAAHEGRELGTTSISAGAIARALGVSGVHGALRVLENKGYITKIGEVTKETIWGIETGRRGRRSASYRINPIDHIKVDEKYHDFLVSREAALAAA